MADCPRCKGLGLDDASGFGDYVPCETCGGSGHVKEKSMSLKPEEMDARDEGRDAFEEGKERSANPYSMLSQKNLWTNWDEGWEEAKNEADEEDEEDEE